MSQQVATDVNPISFTRRLKKAKRNLKQELFMVIAVSFFGGSSLSEALQSRARGGNHWVIDFVGAAACLVVATTAGIHLIRADKAKPPAADAESVLRITAE